MPDNISRSSLAFSQTIQANHVAMMQWEIERIKDLFFDDKNLSQHVINGNEFIDVLNSEKFFIIKPELFGIRKMRYVAQYSPNKTTLGRYQDIKISTRRQYLVY
jgi:hypothetical protein